MTHKKEQGFVVLATNTDSVDYVRCARRLAESLRAWHDDVSCCLVTDDVGIRAPEFDFVLPLPYGNKDKESSWQLVNDWQVSRASPYRETIKLEADMLCCSNIDHWWTMFRHRDVVVSTGCRDIFDKSSTSRYYRKIFDNNNLPDVYSAITYWRRSETAIEFWKWVRAIFESWQDFKTLLKFPDDNPTTDVVYAMAAVMIGVDKVTMPWATYPRIVHMKKHILNLQSNDWTRELVWEKIDNILRINTVTQQGMVHYHVKDWNPDE